MLSVQFFVITGCYLGTILSMEVTQMQYHYWFEDVIHENWIVDRLGDCQMLKCVKNCQKNAKCSGVALGPMKKEEHVMPCLLLANVDEAECEENNDCSHKGYQVYLNKIPPTTTTETPTTTTETTTEVKTTTTSTTTTTTTEPTTTTTEAPTTTTEALTTTTEATTTTTEAPTTTTEAPTTTTETPTTTTEAPTTTTEAPTTTTETPTTTTEAPTTTTEAPTTTTTTEAPTTTTTTEAPTTTTEVPTTTTTEAPTTTTTTTTTEAPTTTTTEKTTTVATTTTTEGEPVAIEMDCTAPPTTIACDEPKAQYWNFGLKANSALFTDAKMKVQCEKSMDNIVKSQSSMNKYEPFSGQFKCKENEIMTGIELCFQMEVKYIGPFCTELESGYEISTSDTGESKNTPQQSNIATCPDKMAMMTLKLQKDTDGNISVIITCAKIVKK